MGRDKMKKKTILFDFLVFEDQYVNGGALYAKTIFYKLLERGANIVGICAHKDRLNPEIVNAIEKNTIPVYEGIENINQVIDKEGISLFFIGIAQRYNGYDLTDVHCEIYASCLDIGDIVMDKANVGGLEYQTIYKKKYEKKRSFLRRIKAKMLYTLRVLRALNAKRLMKTDAQIIDEFGYGNFAKLISQKNAHVVTCSNYSKNTIEFFFDNIANDILVFYTPEVVRNLSDGDGCVEEMKEKKFFLVLSCDRMNKNAYTFFECYKKIEKMHPGEFSAYALGIDKPSEGSIVYQKSVSDLQLRWLIKNCYALIYPSLNEGFGLPPLEAMAQSKPVIAAYDTSIPEVCGDGALYFCPLYADDLYMKINELAEKYDYYCQKGHERYLEIAEKRRADTEKMLDILLA